MFRKLLTGVVGLAALAPTAAAASASFGYNLRLIVPVYCIVNHQSTGSGVVNGDALSLGTFREYCNAPSGYQIVVRYAPGSLDGARMLAGSDEIVLDGSGQAVLSRTTGPRVRERTISMAPGQNGFDTDRLEVDIIPT